MLYHCPVSLGELIDKITILEIKKSKVLCPQKLTNIQLELDKLRTLISWELQEYRGLYCQLCDINLELWEIEDSIRDCESKQIFDQEFVKFARSVYYKNDERAKIKRQINITSGSILIEEKQYAQY